MPVADYYIYLPVNDLELVGVANKWKTEAEKKSKQTKTYEVIIRTSTGLGKWASRKVHGGILRNISPGATVYVLAHGYSAGKTITGPEAAARGLLSMYGGIYSYLQKHYSQACQECEEQKLAAPEEGNAALDAALDDDDNYQKVVGIFAKYVEGGNSKITLERPGAIQIGGRRANGSHKTYSPAEFFSHLRKEELPQVPRLKIFACNTGITPKNQTSSFAEQLYELMKNTYRHTRVFGYLGALNARYGPQSVPKNGQFPDKSSEIWGQFHKSSGDYVEGYRKGVRIVKPTTRGVLKWGSTNQDQIPAHVLRVEFPGGQSVSGNMLMQEDESKPF